MGQTIALVATGTVICFVAVMAAAAICWHLYQLRQSTERTRELFEKLIASLNGLTASNAESAESMTAVPGLLKGILAIAETQVTSITGLEASVNAFRAGLLSGDGSGVSSNGDDGEFDEMQSEREKLRRMALPEKEVAARLQERKLYGGFNRI